MTTAHPASPRPTGARRGVGRRPPATNFTHGKPGAAGPARIPRPPGVPGRWTAEKFADKPTVRDVTLAAFHAGVHFGETSELIDVRYEVRPATDVAPGVYRNVNGTTTTALGLVAASVGMPTCSMKTSWVAPVPPCMPSRTTTSAPAFTASWTS